ncbi:hypothetical protein MMC10_007044 [Thelotrema lepadinum]|nr:hypothetical protein [Thelotrema lepadinum]
MATTHHKSLTSSPDLLGEPDNDPRSSPSRSVKRARSTTPLKQISQPAESYQLQDFYIDTPKGALTRRSSPSKSVAQSENLISPWRIRVRVEAEREDEGVKAKSKSGRKASMSPSKQVARTITTTVPLKGSDDTPAPQKRGRGRPRKSATPAKTPAKRPATPKPGRGRKRTADDADGGESDATRQSSVSRSKKPRRKASPKPMKESEVHNEDVQINDIGQPELQPTTLFTNQQDKKSAKFNIAIDSDASINSASQDTQNQRSNGEPGRINTAVSPAKSSRGKRRPLTSTSPQKGRSQTIAKETIGSPHWDRSDAISDYDSIAEGEDFSIVSLSTLPSAQQHLRAQTLEELNGSISRNPSASASKGSEAGKVLSADVTKDSGTKESKMLSSRPAQAGQTLNSSILGARQSADQSSLLHINFKRTTPSQTFSSPVLPPLKAVHGNTSSRAHENPNNAMPQLARVAKTGFDPQDVTGIVEPIRHETSSQTESKATLQTNAQNRLDDLFSGFGVRSRRELRAGLRLGEELARRQQEMEGPIQSDHHSEDDVFQEIARSSHRRSIEVDGNESSGKVVPEEVRYPRLSIRKQLPSPETSLDENLGQNHKMQSTNAKRVAPPSPSSSVLERQQVSRQIADADSNKVTVVESDNSSALSSDADFSDDQGLPNNAELDDETDIWQTEAKSNSNSQNNSHVSFASYQVQAKKPVPKLPSRTELDRPQPNHLPATLPPAKSQEEIDLYPNLSTAVQYATPKPQKQVQQADANYTGFTNFTNDMLEGEATSRAKRAASLSPRVTKRARLSSSSDTSSTGAIKGRAMEKEVVTPLPALTSAITNPKEDATNKATLRTTAVTFSTIPIKNPQQQKEHRQEQQKPQEEPFIATATSWLDSVSGTIFKTAADALSSFGSYETLRIPREPTFCAPTTPIVRHVPPFTIYFPFNTTHYARLRSIYIKAQRHPKLYPLRTTSPCMEYLDLQIESMGWIRKLETWELAVGDEFMAVLRREGLREDRQEIGLGGELVDKKEIGVDEVVKRVFSLWVGQVQRGEILLKQGVAGRWDRRFVGQRQRALERQRDWKEAQMI